MWAKNSVFYSLILIILLSACQAAHIETIPAEAPQIIKVGLQPSLDYLKEPISVCANQNPAYDVLLLEKNSYNWQEEPVDIIFTSQQAVDGLQNTYLIDDIDVVIIVNPDFPTILLNMNQLQAVFNSEMISPSQIGLSENTELTIYGFELSSDISAMFAYQYGFSPELPVDAFLAASPLSVVEKIANGSISIGYTLSPTVTDQVKVLNVSLDYESTPIPVIASLKSSLSPVQESFISCLQTSLIE